MSATRPLTQIEQFLIEKSESLSQLLHGKSFADLDEVRQARIMGSARKALKDTIFYEPQPGTCFNCGRATTMSHQFQCWRCHEGTHPTDREVWLEKNNRLHPSEVRL